MSWVCSKLSRSLRLRFARTRAGKGRKKPSCVLGRPKLVKRFLEAAQFSCRDDRDILGSAPVDTLAVMAIWATHDGVTDAMAYEVTKALYENTETLGQVHPKGKEISLKTALQSVSIPLHPGAEKYYREMGLLKK